MTQEKLTPKYRQRRKERDATRKRSPLARRGLSWKAALHWRTYLKRLHVSLSMAVQQGLVLLRQSPAKVVAATLAVAVGLLFFYPEVMRARLDSYEDHLNWPWRLMGSDSRGLILLDTPQIFTRGRLVNDRTKEAEWLGGRLDKTDTLMAEGRFKLSQGHYATRRKMSWNMPADSLAGSKAERPALPQGQPGPIDEFERAADYREAIRNKIMSTVLDDRHDTEGNSIYRLNFNVSVLPPKGSSKVALVVASVREFGEGTSGNRAERHKAYTELMFDWQKELQSLADRDRLGVANTLFDPRRQASLPSDEVQNLHQWAARQLTQSPLALQLGLNSDKPDPAGQGRSAEQRAQEFLYEYGKLTSREYALLAEEVWKKKIDSALKEFVRKPSDLGLVQGQGRSAPLRQSSLRATPQPIKWGELSQGGQDQRAVAPPHAGAPKEGFSPGQRNAAIAGIKKVINELSSEPEDRYARFKSLCVAQLKEAPNFMQLVNWGPQGPAGLEAYEISELSVSFPCPVALFQDFAVLDLLALLEKADPVNVNWSACAGASNGSPSSARPDSAVPPQAYALALAKGAARLQLPAGPATPCSVLFPQIGLFRDAPALLEFARSLAVAKWRADYLSNVGAKIDSRSSFREECDCDNSTRCKVRDFFSKTKFTRQFVQREKGEKEKPPLMLSSFYSFHADPSTARIRVQLQTEPNSGMPRATDVDRLRELMCRRAYAHTYAVFGNDKRLSRSRTYEAEQSAQEGSLSIADNVSAASADRSPQILGFRDWTGTKPAGTGQDYARARFGWAILPQPREDSGQGRGQQADNYAVSALVSLPGWWRTAHLEVRTCWVSESELRPNLNPGETCGSFDSDTTNRFDIRLQSPSGNVDLMENLRFFVEKVPSVYNFDQPVLEAGRSAAVRIPGVRLWRSPVVLLGQQQADSVEVLPDMKGIIAKFNCVRTPVVRGNQGMSGEGAELPLIVTTSEGTLGNPVKAFVMPFKPKQFPAEQGKTRLELDCEVEAKLQRRP